MFIGAEAKKIEGPAVAFRLYCHKIPHRRNLVSLFSPPPITLNSHAKPLWKRDTRSFSALF
jgi:hypothetical protein